MSNELNDKTGKALYRIDEVADILSVSRRTVYRLLAEGKLKGHSRNPRKPGMRITAWSVKEFIKKYELPPDYFLDKAFLLINRKKRSNPPCPFFHVTP